MTVKELIEQLQQCDQTLEVYVADSEYGPEAVGEVVQQTTMVHSRITVQNLKFLGGGTTTETVMVEKPVVVIY